jgi:hypothetical protein
MNMTVRNWLSVVVLGAACAGGAQAANISLTFDTDAQGITGTNGTVAHEAAGYLAQTDIDADNMSLHLPASLLGNWSQFLGGTLSFDAINLSGVASDWGDFGQVTLTGSAGQVTVDLAAGEAPGGTWQTYATTLDAATWGGNLSNVLADVTGVSIVLESHNGFGPGNSEINGFDNFKVSAAAVPEPSTWALLATGLVLMAGVTRRRARS